MIVQWAEARGMHVDALKIFVRTRAWAIEGFAALRILEDECGLHIGKSFGTGRLDLVPAGHFDLMDS